MNKIIVIYISIIFFASSCEKENTVAPIANFSVTMDSAHQMVEDWIFDEYNPDMNPDISFSLKELTTSDIYSGMHSQVFEIDCDVPGLSKKIVLINNQKVYDLGHNDFDPENDEYNFMLADWDQNGQKEMYYVVTYGSGILRSGIYCFDLSAQPHVIYGPGVFNFPIDYCIGLKSSSDKIEVLYIENRKKTGIGTLSKTYNAQYEPEIRVILYDNIPDYIIEKITGERLK